MGDEGEGGGGTEGPRLFSRKRCPEFGAAFSCLIAGQSAGRPGRRQEDEPVPPHGLEAGCGAQCATEEAAADAGARQQQ